ncbi:adenylate/guanylate cyclase domain-containing protein [Myxococcota bacterium]|nr:adenylate/guanylate cyclase domain-containing protein [Myxococcota bacterium]
MQSPPPLRRALRYSGALRALVFDALSVALLSLYGGEVCPLIEQLGPLHLGQLLIGVYALSQAIALPLGARLEAGLAPEGWPEALARLTFYRTFAIGVLVTFGFTWGLGFPVESGLKMLIGAVTLGLISALDGRFYAEGKLIDAAERGELQIQDIGEPSSRVHELMVLGATGLIFSTLVLVLVVRKDLADLAFVSQIDLPGALRDVTIEFSFVGAVLVGGLLHLLRLVGGNLKRLVDAEAKALGRLTAGELDVWVPISSRDELGHIAVHTNRLVDAMRERKRVFETFGKAVSPQVAARLLQGGAALGGERKRVVVMFVDIRDFTPWVERTSPEALVRDLNRFFTEAVRVIHRRGGLVDKFIGDGLMAVFGLDEPEGAESAAALAALELQAAFQALGAGLEHPLRAGVGVHVGEVVAGVIGSPDRLEFTVVGDAVNTAARVEGLTRTLGVDVLLTGSVIAGLPEPGAWRSLGEHGVKGRAAQIEVFTPA